MTDNYKTIQIKRNRTILESKEEALVFLNRIPHTPGQPVMVTYRLTDTDTDTMLALGISDGVGPDHYRLMGASGTRVVSGIIGSSVELPDSTSLTNGQTYLYKEPATGLLYWIYLEGTERIDVAVDPGVHYKVFNLLDNTEYWVYGGDLEKINNYYSRDKMDSLLSGILGQVKSSTETLTQEVRESIEEIRQVLGTPSGIAGTFGQTDIVLQGKITENRGRLDALGHRIEVIEEEVFNQGDSRIDQLYDWYESVITKPQYSVRFEKVDNEPLISGTTHYYRATYQWEWADKAGITGLKLNTETIDLPNPQQGTYAWDFEWTIPVLSETPTEEWEASFLGDPTEYRETLIQEAISITRSVTIGYPTEVPWKPAGSGFSAPVKFIGTGLPRDWAGNEMVVRENGTKAFSRTQGVAPDQTVVYDAYLDTSVATKVKASWGGEDQEIDFYPVTYTIGETTKCGYFPDNNFMIPAESFTAGDTLIIKSPIPFGDNYTVTCSVGNTWTDVTGDFEGPQEIEYLGTTYHTLTFRNIGTGTFKFKIQDGNNIS